METVGLLRNDDHDDHEDEEEHRRAELERTKIQNASVPSLHTLSVNPTFMEYQPQTLIDLSDSLHKLEESFQNPVPLVTPVTAAMFVQIVDEVKAAISAGIYPTRISKGSSGSYFCRNRSGNIVGVFKPKNEEPVKAAASFLDRRLGLNVVPRTEIVLLSSPTFFYGPEDRAAYRRGTPLPPKMGSFQIFLNGFKDATSFFREGYEQVLTGALPTGRADASRRNANWSRKTQMEFRWGFERLVVLDYLIRNTDRGKDNWMVKYYPSRDAQANANGNLEEASSQLADAQNESVVAISEHNAVSVPPEEGCAGIYVAAIDNGLAFPYKHPDRWRSYPYGWSTLPIAKLPFSSATRSQVLYFITSPSWWRETMDGLERLFKLDSDFNDKMWKKQRSVIRGEGYNLAEVLRRAALLDQGNGSPWELIQRPVVAVYEEDAEDHDFRGDSFQQSMQRARQRYLFQEGVMVAKKDFNAPKHGDLDVPNLHVIKALQSMESRGLVKVQFSWQYYYYYLTDSGIEYLRKYLHLPPEIVPRTHIKTTKATGTRPRPDGERPPRGEGYRSRGDGDGYRRRDAGEKKEGASGDFRPEFRGGVGRGGPRAAPQ
ncbi:phosphatidyl inositol kinase [Blyttiomyces sp. JEL0837]|nr:phosphatidyl inositol kinase [Blyttiomyces sp. JEL0837]